MIRIFKPNDTNYSSNGEKVIKPFEAIITKTVEEEYVEIEAQLKYAEFLLQENIIVIDTYTGKRGYRIHNPIVSDVISIKAWLCYQEKYIPPADRGVVIAHGKNLENCKKTEIWDDVVTKLIPVGYKDIRLPEGYLSVPHSYPKDYEKVIEFELSENLEETIDLLEETISIMESLEKTLKASVVTLQAKFDSYDSSINSLTQEKERLYARLAQLGNSEVELKEKAVINAQIPMIDKDIALLREEKNRTLAALNKSKDDLLKATKDVTDTTQEYNTIIINDLRTQAQAYINKNQYPSINYDLESRLDGIIEVGDTVHVKHPAMRLDLLTYVTNYKWDCLNNKFTGVEFGTSLINLKSKFREIEKAVDKVGKEVRHTNGTVSKYFSEYKRDNEEMISKFIEELYGSVDGLFGQIEKNTSIIRQTASEISGTVERLNSNLSSDIAQIKIKADEITLTVEHNYYDLNGKISQNSSAITQTASSIRSEVTQTLKSYSTTTQMTSAINQSATSITSTVNTRINGVEQDVSRVEQTANKISWLVKSGSSASDFTLTDRAISLVSEKINLTGFVTFNDLSGAGKTTINGSNITTGTIDANIVTVSNINASNIITGSLNAARISSGTLDCSKITVTNLNASAITTGILDASKVTVKNLNADNITSGGLSANYIKMNDYLVMNQGSYSNSIKIGSTSSQYVNLVEIGAQTFHVQSPYVKLGIASSMLGFFGASGSQKIPVATLSSSAALSTAVAKINELINAFKSYGQV